MVPNALEFGDTLAAVVVPKPLTSISCVPAESTMSSLPDCEPVPTGVKVTVIVQLAAAARLVPQVVVNVKLGDVVMKSMLVIATGVAPILVTVAV